MSNGDLESSNIVEIVEEKGKRERIRKAKSKTNFTLINTVCLQDPRLSMSALGMLAYLMSLPCDWEISVSHLSKRFNCSKDKVYSTINELIKLGYMVRYQERNDNGAFGEWITEATDDPNLLKGAQPLAISEFPPHKEKPEAVKTGSGKNRYNKELTSNKLIKNNKQSPIASKSTPELQSPSPELDANVVVSLMEKLEQWAIAETLLRTWLRKHSAEYILCKIEYTKSYATKNPAGLLRRAIEHDYKLPQSKQTSVEQKAPVDPVYPTHEENLAWYAGLSDEDKLALQKEAVHKHSMFEHHLKHQNVLVIDQDFMQNGLFKDMMRLIGRAK